MMKNALRGILQNKKIPAAPVFLGMFILLAAGCLTAIFLLEIPFQVIFLLAIVLLGAAAFYPRWVSLVMFAVFLGAVIWLAAAPGISEGRLPDLVTSTLVSSVSMVMLLLIAGRLEDARIRLHLLADHATYLEAWVDPSGAIAYISPSCEDVTGYTPAEFYANPNLFNEMVAPIDRPLLEPQNANQAEIELRIIQKSGKERWIVFSYKKIFIAGEKYLGIRASARDITEIKKDAAELVKSTERITLAMEGTEDGLWDMDMTTGTIFFSPTYAVSLGFKSDQNEVRVADFRSLIHPGDRSAVLKAIEAHMKQKTENYHAEYRLRNAQGEWKWVLDRGKVIRRSPTGRALRMIGTHVDITSRKNIEQALSQSEEKFRQLAENMREVFWLRDRSTGNFLYISPAYSEIWGRTFESLHENPNWFLESIHPDDLAKVYKGQKDLFGKEQKVFNEEFRVTQPDGSTRWVWVREYPVLDEHDQYYRTTGVAEDITERIRTYAALKDSERRYRDLIESQGGGVSIIDPNERFVYVNPAGEEIFGVPRGSLINRNLSEFMEENQFSFIQKQASLRQQGVETTTEFAIRRPDGDKRDLLVTATPRFDANGQFLGAIAIFRDITQRKIQEDELRFLGLHDALTGLNNRTFFQQQITHLEENIQLFPVSVIMLDLDDLKVANDTQGHAVGDDLLIRSARVLRRSLRSADAVARIGGDEFAVLMPNANESALSQAMSRIQATSEAENKENSNLFPVNLSMGGTTCQTPAGLRDAIRSADLNMYRDKDQRKKNRGQPGEGTQSYLIAQRLGKSSPEE